MIIVYVVCKDDKEAKCIANSLLQKRLIICTNMFPVQSIFWWKEKLREENETAMILKTRKENFEKVRAEVRRLHGYAVPCIFGVDVDKVDSDYLKWLNEEVR